MDTLNSALTYVNEKLINYIARELFKPMLSDPCPLVVKCLFDQVSSFEPNEIRQACDVKELKLISSLF